MVNGIDGVQMINPSSIGGEFWYLETNPMADQRFNCSNIQGNYTDGFTCTDDPATMTIETSMGYSHGSVRDKINHAFIASTGFMYRSNDFRNVEFTGYFDCRNVTNDNARIQFFARSAEVGEERQWCPGSMYMGELAMDGRFRWVKCQYWLSCFERDWISAGDVGLGSDLRQRSQGWFGVKIVVNNIDIGEGKLGVKLQLYVDRGNNNLWTFVGSAEVVDNGGWGQDGKPCGGNDDQIITWGAPLVTVRLEGDPLIVFNKLSVREVDVGGQFITPATTQQSDAALAGAFQRVIGMITLRYRVGVSLVPTCLGEIPTDPDPPPGPPGPGTVFVEMRLAHRFDIIRQQTTVTTIEEMPAEVVA